MTELEEKREIIEKIDKKMAELFKERMDAAKYIAEYKKENNLPIYDPKREEELINKNKGYISDPVLKHYYERFLKAEMDISKSYQQSLNTNGIHVDADSSYDVIIERGLLLNAKEYLSLDRKVLIITDSGVPLEYSRIIEGMCKEPFIFTIEKGEASKSIENYESILSYMVDKGFRRDDCIVAVGGGVVGDLSAFIASTYMRGIDFYNIPTTLLSMVDSSVGGKTGIDFNGVKNIVGSFYQPKCVLIDPNVLYSLNEREFNAGLVEAYKMGLTFYKDLVDLIENSDDTLKDIDEIIRRSISIKAVVVEEDTKEKGIRSALNFGHTLGHAFEAFSNGKLLHGEAVGLGMLYISEGVVKEHILAFLKKYNLPTEIKYDKNEILYLIERDKKAKTLGDIKVVLSPEIGKYKFEMWDISKIEEVLWTHLETILN